MPERENNFYFPIYQEPQDSIPQDTTRRDTLRPDSSIQTGDTSSPSQSLTKDTSEQRRIREPEISKLDSINRAEQQDPQKNLQQKLQKKQAKQLQQTATPREETDTLSILYEITGATEIPVLEKVKNQPSYTNFLYNIPTTKPSKGNINVYENTQEKTQAYTEEPTKPNKIEPEQPLTPTFDWVSYLVIALFIFLGWTRIFFKRYFNTLFKSFHFINYAEELFQEKSSLTIRGATFLNGFYFIVLGLFSLQGIKYFYPSIPMAEYKIFFLSTGFFGAWYIWNAFFKQFIGSVFQKLKVFTEYFYNYNIYRKIAGIIIFPILVISQYIQEELVIYFIYSATIIFIIIYLTHILRGLQIFMKNKVSIFYLILYLCALEFLPLLVFYEWITKEL